MTGAQTLAAFRRALLPAIAAGIGVLALVLLVLLTRPVSYDARIGLVASPKVTGQGMPSDYYGAVVSLTMQALPELAVSDGTLTAIRAAVPQAPSVAELRTSITVELVPGSGVARVSVVARERATAVSMLNALITEIQRADLLAPAAELEAIGAGGPTTQIVERDPLLALGLGLVGGLIASLITVVAVQALRPRLLTVADVEQVVEEVFAADEPPPVVALDDRDQGLTLLAAHLLAQKPVATGVTVVPAGIPLRDDLAPRLRNALRTLRVARDAGLPVGPAVASRSGHPFEQWLEAGTKVVEPATMPSGVPIAGPDGGPDDAPAAPAPRRQGMFGTIAPPGAGAGADNVPAAVSPNPLSHLVVTVRLGGTTPTELTTSLVAMRTHGTGVAGVAVG